MKRHLVTGLVGYKDILLYSNLSVKKLSLEVKIFEEI